MHRYLLAIALVCFVQSASAQVPDTVFLEKMTWEEVRDALAAGKTTVIVPNESRRRYWPATDRVTATAAEVISTRTPVAYAPPCASTFASKMMVMMKVMTVKSTTSGREALAHSGAMPYLGR